MIKTIIKRAITTSMIFIGIIVVGIIAMTSIPKDLFPEFTLPLVIVYSSYNGAGPSEVESLVTKPLESALSAVSDLKTLTSQSSNGTCMIMLEFNDGIEMDMAALNAREKIDLVKDYLPDGTTAPMVVKIDPNQLSTLTLSINSKRYDVVKLNSFIEDNIKPQLEKINGVAEVSLSGGKEKVINITCYPEKLTAYGLQTSQISQLLASENLNLPGGILLEGEKDIAVRTIGEFNSINDIRNLPIQTQRGTIYLRDVAEITEDYKDVSSYSFVNGEEAITLSIQKQSVANTVKVAEKVVQTLDKLQKQYEDLIEINIILNSADYINESISSVASSAIIGGLLAVLILYIFLRNIWPTLVIATSIPTSILATFALMYLCNMTLNIVTLGALTIAIGMLVDASIVVLENIDIHRKMGKSSADAANDGAKEVITSVIASTLTSLVVFMPFVFTTGTIMQILHAFAWVVMFALMASLVTSLTLVPMLSSRLPEGRKELKNKFFRNLTRKFEKFINKIIEVYGRALEAALHNKKKVVRIVLWICGLSLIAILFVDKSLMPASDEGIYQVSISMPDGTNLDKTLEQATKVCEILENTKGTKSLYLTVGGTSMLSSGGSATASISVDIGDPNKRRYTTDDIISIARKNLADIAGCKIEIGGSGSGMSAMVGAGCDIQLTGDDNNKLHEIADEIIKILQDVDGLAEIKKSNDAGSREAKIEIDRNILSLYGLSTYQVASAIQTSITGTKATTLKVDGEEIDVMISIDDSQIKYVKDLSNIFVQSPISGENIPLTALGEISIDKTASTITRTNQKNTLDITAELDGIALGTAQTRVDNALKKYDMPEGYSYSWAGSMEMMNDSFRSLGIALVMAVLLVYMVMASQFESLFNPFIIMFTVPLAFAGSFIGLFITGTELDVIAIMGMIVLVGIVVNNGIILIDFITKGREEGLSMEAAILKSGKQRLRPILMTTLTTILGMLPMAFQTGEGSEMRGLAIVVIFGLTTSTLLTLFIIPILYQVLNTKLEAKREQRKMLRQKYGEDD